MDSIGLQVIFANILLSEYPIRSEEIFMNLFYSTRGHEKAVTAPEAVLRGIAPDGGLYTPKAVPQIKTEELLNADFKAMAKTILGAYLTGYTQEEIDQCVDLAYDEKFDTPEICPVKQVGDKYMLELFHGPTAAFKDVALSILPRLMSCAMEKEGKEEEILILTATSGDTGSAALTGFCDVPGIRIIVFFPDKGISPIQRAQMTTMQGSNVGVCALTGNFDDAQTGVKRIFTGMDAAFLRENKLSLSSANSINIGRLAPQIVYYYSSYIDLVRMGKIKMGDKLNFCVPTGNFGDILAGYFAYLSGLPVGKLICASNANNVLTDFLSSGEYDRKRPFMVTTSPSMDILVSSNLERLLYLSQDCDGEKTAALMSDLQTKGSYAMPEEAMNRVRAMFAGECAGDEAALDAIKRVFEAEGYVMDPHTAVAWKAAEDYAAKSGDNAPTVVLSTASPYKFPASVLKGLGVNVPEDAAAQTAMLEEISKTKAPRPLAGVLEREVRFNDLVDAEDMMSYVMGKAARK